MNLSTKLMHSKKTIFLFALIFILFLVFLFFKSKNVSKYSIEIKVQDLERSTIDIKNTLIPVPTKMENGIPNNHLIETAFVPQAPEKNWQQPWQDACEEAALLTLEYYYKGIKTVEVEKIKTDLIHIFEYQSDLGWGHDINISKMADLSKNYFGLTPEIIEEPTIDQIKTYLSRDIPLIATANGKTLHRENKRFKDGGPWYHAVVILGYDSTTDQFIVHDVGTQFGAYFRYSQDLLLSAIHDLPPSEKKEDIDQGLPRVLLLVK